MKRMASLLYARIDKEQKILKSQVEDLIKKGTALSKQERRLSRKAVMMEVFQAWNDPALSSEGLPVKIKRAVEARVDQVAESTSDRVIRNYKERIDLLEEKLANLESGYTSLEVQSEQHTVPEGRHIAELEERLAALEATLLMGSGTSHSPPSRQASETGVNSPPDMEQESLGRTVKMSAVQPGVNSAPPTPRPLNVTWSMYT